MPWDNHSSPIDYIIHIAVDPPGMVPEGGSCGNFVYTPALLHVNKGDKVTWTCDNPFALVFKEGSPVGQLEVQGCAASTGYTAGPMRIEASQGSFHYAVAVWDGSKVFVDAACPRISVN